MRLTGKKKRVFEGVYRTRKFISRERYERLVELYTYMVNKEEKKIGRGEIATLGEISESVGVRDMLYLIDTGIIKRIGNRWPLKYVILEDITKLEQYVSCLDEYLGVGEYRDTNGSN